ncbi:hypothetical protein K1T71_000709 [Dendrolimus kikuchii]|uniref:Uncharacterized protein n=1 Tax=Dendrolimus kikuchii TaxID=765133 RepID=A0ACC1DK61_9NEOP|nr:hypothetical protein K1T71_000709 [Dendrolimus kikuchii]
MMALCDGCLASDRTLKPGTTSLLYLLHFLNITPNKGRPKKNTNLILFCWECSSFLNRVKEFHCKVNIAQEQLKKLRNKTELKPLSNLHITTIKKDYDLIITEEEKLCTELEIKEEFDYSENVDEDKFETFENYYKSDHSDLEKTEDDIKDYTDAVTLTQLTDIKVKNEIKLESKDTLDVSDIKNESGEGVIQKKSRKGQIQKKKYKVLCCTELQSEELTKYIEESETDVNKIRQWFHRIWQTMEFTSNKYKCLCCLKTFVTEKGYLSHKKIHHLNGQDKFVCDICDRGFETRPSLILHLQAHKYKYTCKLCKEDFYMKNRILTHLQRHRTRIQCRECGVVFEWLREFYAHYRSLHAVYTCDYCGKMTRIKSSLEKHILVHTLKYCKICDINFKASRHYLTHYKMQHLKTEDESAYCVECDMKFPNMDRYKYHLRTAVRHIDKSKYNKKYPCPICKKEYAKRLTMKYHYQHYHLKKTKFYCEKCNKYMLNPFQLREHNARVHEKIPLPKNKICDICGRGFSDKKVLINHRRTHTGERPFQCEYCSAAFAQKSAMNTHMKTQHKVFLSMS